MRVLSCLITVLVTIGLAIASPIAATSLEVGEVGNKNTNLVRQVAPPFWNTPDGIPCATTWPEEGGAGPAFTWNISPEPIPSVNGFVHAHVFVGFQCRFWDNLQAKGDPRVVAKSDGKSTDWWGPLHFRAYAIQCSPMGWNKLEQEHVNGVTNTTTGIQGGETQRQDLSVSSSSIKQTPRDKAAAPGPGSNTDIATTQEEGGYCGSGFNLAGVNGAAVVFKVDGYYTVGNLLEWPVLSVAIMGHCKCTFCDEEAPCTDGTQFSPQKPFFMGDLPFKAKSVFC